MKLGVYKHFKGKEYRVICVAKHSETLDDFVVYECLHENPTSKFWVRPMSMFLEKVNVNGREVPRYKYLGE